MPTWDLSCWASRQGTDTVVTAEQHTASPATGRFSKLSDSLLLVSDGLMVSTPKNKRH